MWAQVLEHLQEVLLSSPQGLTDMQQGLDGGPLMPGLSPES